jgi:hypothetical protein
LRKLGEYELAWLAGDRGVALGERDGNLIDAALTGFRVAITLTSLGRAKAAFDLNVSYASRLECDLSYRRGKVGLRAYPLAGRHGRGDAAGVRDMNGEAKSIARHVPDQANHYRLSFAGQSARFPAVSCRTVRSDDVNRVLYVIACGAPPAREVTRIIIPPKMPAGMSACW